MKREDEQVSAGLNELFEIINAKGDTGELKSIIQNYQSDSPQDKDGKKETKG
ncbi:hypothetical protein [Heyndrickxia acidiproducens]|uniref:hypothetical protein n=1 Tax=Heyndrickxia acidiproducens TaxID=1121084 RepID=UPI00037D4556|nr:hypothetical protein [Heyndrickxia acidiproducens]